MFERAIRVIDDQLTASAGNGRAEDLPRLAAVYVVVLVTQRRNAAGAMHEMIVAATHDPLLQDFFHRHQDRLGGLLSPCVGGYEAGLAVAASLQGMTLASLTYPDADPGRLHGSVLELMNRLRVDPPHQPRR